MTKKLYIFLILVCISSFLKAQYVDYGSDPSRLKWNKVETEHYKIIYPQEYSLWAQHYAIILEKSYAETERTLKSKNKISKYPVIIHSYNARNNGMVSWAPKRMELLPINGSGESFQLTNRYLAVHEQRHVFQMTLLARKTGFLRFLLGEQISVLPAALTPRWFLEGDAVTTETALSSSGRGRQANFLMPYRAQYETGKNFSYDKWNLGSYKDYTHDFYAIGYATTAYARIEYGDQVWNNVLRGMSIIPGTFSRNLRRKTSKRPKKLFEATFKEMAKEWAYFDSINVYDNENLITDLAKKYTDYKSPVQTSEGIIAIKWSQSQINSLVLIDNNGKEHFLTYVGNINSKLLTDGVNVFWTSYNPSVRWEHESYSNIVSYNLNTKIKRHITSKQKYYSPAVNSDGTNIAVYQPQSNGVNNIVIIHSVTGEVIKTFSVINNGEVKDIVFNENNLIASVVTDKGNSLMQLDIELGEWYGLIRPIRANISQLRSYKNYILFQSGYSGINNIYAFNILSLSVEKWTNTRFGATDPFVTADEDLLYTSYTNKGYKLVKTPVESINTTATSFNSPYQFQLAGAISKQEKFNIDTISYQGEKPYKEKRFRKGLNLFNVHSWMPIHVSKGDLHMQVYGDTDVNLGVTLLSQNNLNTLVSSVAFYHNLKDRHNHGELYFKYSAMFPVIQATLDIGGRNVDYAFLEKEGKYYAYPKMADRTALNLEIGTYLPFSFNKNALVHGIQPFLNYTLTTSKIQEYPWKEGSHNFKYVDFGVYYYLYRQMAMKDIYPQLGVQAWIRGVGNLSSNQNFTRLYSAETNIFLPGIVRNHSFRVNFVYQHQELGDNIFIFPKRLISDIRGFSYLNTYSESAINVKLDYSFALAHPDFSLWSLMYLKRIRTNLFFDYNRGDDKGSTLLGSKYYTAHSYGAEFLFDANWLRVQAMPIGIGFRLGYKSGGWEKNSTFGDFLLSYTIN